MLSEDIRRDWRWEDDEWYFSVVDFVAIVIGAEYKQARKYWAKLKERLINFKIGEVRGIAEIGEIELVTEIFNNCHQLKMRGKDNKPHPTDAMNINALDNLLKFIPSKNKRVFLREYDRAKKELVEPTLIIEY